MLNSTHSLTFKIHNLETSLSIDWFSRFFHCYKISPWMLCYTTLWNLVF